MAKINTRHFEYSRCVLLGPGCNGIFVLRGTMLSFRHNRTNPLTQSEKQYILDRDIWCVYCGDVATEVDHVVPYSWDHCNDMDNLVGACRRCNSLASNKIFPDFDAKKEYILYKISHRRNKHKDLEPSLCMKCGRSFIPHFRGSTVFLCKHCARVYGVK
jgi:hypothetical protein